jgi:hypothetical protein
MNYKTGHPQSYAEEKQEKVSRFSIKPSISVFLNPCLAFPVFLKEDRRLGIQF